MLSRLSLFLRGFREGLLPSPGSPSFGLGEEVGEEEREEEGKREMRGNACERRRVGE